MRYHLLIIILLLCSCNPKNIFQDYEMIHVTTFPITAELSGEKIALSPEGILALHVTDTFMIVHQIKLPEYMTVYGQKSLHKLKTLLTKGRGPNEFRDFTYRGQYCNRNHNTEIYFSDINKSSLYALDLTQSIQQDSLVIKRIAKIPYPSFPTFLTDSFYISKTFLIDQKKIAYILHDSLAHTIHAYPLYDHVSDIRYNQMGSADQIKPDLSKIVMGMISFNQINILDLKGNRNFSITTSHSPTWLSEEYFENNDYTIYYCALSCTDEKIYALYVEQKISEWQRVKKPVEIHVFNWEGEALYKLKIKENLLNFDIDESSNKLYGLATEEEIFVYDISAYI